ncbi:MAG: HAMP domain-containing histidine kinase [Devosia sp.]|uniref:sensor histidine kinase n=1 Tax=Devosia sp. TaxID=1871048 RepID=UPI001A480235|nr:HAMP domain-containing sensor histidine kinase [Devosia sp.]MBL8598599.1 HAMP domain-containing histidine kinase [Devosia sp.]
MSERRAMPGLFSGLSVKLIATITLVILAVEVVIYLPSAGNFRQSWLNDRLRIGIVAARVLDTVPDVMNLPAMMTDNLLTSAGAIAIVYRRAGQSQLIELDERPMPKEAVTVDMRQTDYATLIMGAIDTLTHGGDRVLRILGNSDGTVDEEAEVEVLIDERPLHDDLIAYSWNIVLISLLVALLTAGVLYLLVSRLLIVPIRRLTENMVAYRRNPENATLIIAPTKRKDEIGIVENELAAMETDIFSMLRQRRHLADLGLAVAKINHDLRNTLTSAQMLSDQVVALDDPKIQRLAPRLLHSIDKAVAFAQSVVEYGRQSGVPPRPQPVDLRALVDESAIDAGLRGHPALAFDNAVPDALTIKVDPDQLARVLVNLMKNAREALEAAGDRIADARVTVFYTPAAAGYTISIADNGPGLPPRARDNLFVAFEGSAKAGGTGLGLAIARELVAAHGGTLTHVPLDPGTRFDITLPAATLVA